MNGRTWLGAALLALACAAWGGVAVDDQYGDGGVPDFYRWPAALPAAPGIMLRQQPMAPEPGLDAASRAQRVLYTSTDGVDGRRRIIVSGAVFFPQGRPPAGGWPVIAWAHGTVGVADVCAPSWAGMADDRVAYLDAWLKAGYAVVASDYQGLGTPGPHPYLHPRPEGYGILDGVRAALAAYPGELANKVVAVGQSQGSGAALAAAQLAPAYAPELHYLGTVATGLVPELAHADGAPQLPLPPGYAYADSEEAAFAMIYLLGTVRALHPPLHPDAYLSQAGRGLEQVALHGCFHDAMAYARLHRLSVSGLYTRSVASLEQEAARRTAFDSARVATPVFTGTGLDDRLMEPAHQYNFIASMCHQGSTVEWHAYPGLTHMTAVDGSLRDSMPFVRRLFAGEPVAGNCGALVAAPWARATASHYAH